jgi:hypothetical protein
MLDKEEQFHHDRRCRMKRRKTERAETRRDLEMRKLMGKEIKESKTKEK